MAGIAQSRRHPSYNGSPETDSKFVRFIIRHARQTVHLTLDIIDGEMVAEGYRGTIPYFRGKKTNGINYGVFLECPNSPDLGPIAECKDVIWVPDSKGGGELSGLFKVVRIGKTRMKRSRAVWLAPTRP